MSGETGPTGKFPYLFAPSHGKVALGERDLPALEPGQVRVKTEVSMVSPGTELHHILETHTKATTFPRATGYISVGRIAGIAKGVEGLQLGQRVHCSGGHLAWLNQPAGNCLPVPAEVDSVDAAAVTLLGISLRGVRAGKVRLGDSTAVFGLGAIGLFAAHLAKVAGANPVIGVDPVGMRREVARELGVDAVLDPRACDVAAEIRARTDGEGARVAIDASATPKVIAALPEVTARFGTLVVLGGVHGLVPMDLYTRFQKSNLTMVGCGNAYPTDYPFDEQNNHKTLLRMLASGQVRPRPAITHIVPFQKGPEIYRLLIEEKDKIIGAAFRWD